MAEEDELYLQVLVDFELVIGLQKPRYLAPLVLRLTILIDAEGIMKDSCHVIGGIIGIGQPVVTTAGINALAFPVVEIGYCMQNG